MKIHQNMPFQSKLNLTSKYLEDTKDEKFEQSTLKESAHRENVSWIIIAEMVSHFSVSEWACFEFRRIETQQIKSWAVV